MCLRNSRDILAANGFLLFSLFMYDCSVDQHLPIQESAKPNIVLFLVDDMGWQDTSVPFADTMTYYNRLYRTPNMERLASEGMKFTQAYATPVCSPTRVSLMTGMNAARHRVTNWTLHKDVIQPMESNHKSLDFPFWNVNGLNPIPGDSNAVFATSLPHVLQDAGYYTVHAGKAHLGAIDTPGEDPLNLGFDINIAGHAAGAPASYYGEDHYGNASDKPSVWAVPGLEAYHGSEINLTEAITQQALQALDTVVMSSEPFFLYLSHYAVHTPIMGDKRFIQHYLDLGIDTTEAKYASMVEAMDKSLGDVMDYLDENEFTDETVILFMSDNGGLSAVARGGTPHRHNLPLASGKGSVYEGGIREPMIVKWPNRVKPNTVSDQYLIIEDFFPSIVEIAGLPDIEVVQAIDGQSFVPLLFDNSSDKPQDRPLFWHYPNEWGVQGPGIGASSAIRLGDYKLIYYHEDESYELFNIREDIGEQVNLNSQNQEKAEELAKKLTAYLKQVDAQMPIHKQSRKKVNYP